MLWILTNMGEFVFFAIILLPIIWFFAHKLLDAIKDYRYSMDFAQTIMNEPDDEEDDENGLGSPQFQNMNRPEIENLFLPSNSTMSFFYFDSHQSDFSKENESKCMFNNLPICGH